VGGRIGKDRGRWELENKREREERGEKKRR